MGAPHGTGSHFLDRLSALRPPSGQGGAAAQALPPDPLHREATRAPLDALISPRATPFGPLHLVERPLTRWCGVCPDTLEALTLSQAKLDPSRPLFLDTETTGLAGGTGTLAFLVGTARVVDGAVHLEQAHLPGPGQERPILQWLRQRLDEATLLVTFNGKSFDWPLLKSRFILNRLAPPAAPPHVDLLHCARRVFRHESPQCTLSALERLALGHHREGDIDGALIPAVWFDFLRTGRVAMLGRVLQHNARDVHSMVELLELLAQGWEGRRALSNAGRFGLAKLASRRGDTARALRFLASLEATTPGPLAGEALELKALLLRRRGAMAAAAEALEEALSVTDAPGRVRLALAKLYEHQLKDFAAARAHALEARAVEPVAQSDRRLRRLASLETRATRATGRRPAAMALEMNLATIKKPCAARAEAPEPSQR